jgi:AcrR family transcriptional regulator
MSVKDRPPAKRLRDEHAEATRAALIKTARELFAARGYADVSIEDISDGTRVTRGALYHHFADKKDLFRAVFEEVQRELVARVREAAEATAKKTAARSGPWTRLRRACHAYLDVCLDPRMQQIVVRDASGVLGWHTWCELDRAYGLGVLEEELARARDAGELAPQSLSATAHLLLGTLNTAATVVSQSHEPEVALAQVRGTIERLLLGLRKAARR